MANWNLPSISDLYADVISLFKSRDTDLAKGMDPARVTVTNPEQYFIRWNSANNKWEIFNGTTWGDLAATFAINVDKVDGADAGTAANNVLKLDGSGKVPVGNLPATSNALEALATYGILTKTAAGTLSARILTGPAAGITVANGDGVAGNPTLALANDLAAIEALASTGFAVRTGADAWAQRSIAAGTALGVTNGDGVAGNPTVAITNALLVAMAGLVTAADKGLYFTAADTPATYTLTAAARALLDDANAGAMLTTLGVSAFVQTLLDDANAGAFRATAGAAADVTTQTAWIPAGAITPRTTNGPAAGTTETATNKVMLKTLDFDAATAEYAQFHARMPKGWDRSTVKFRAVWKAGNTGNVVWGFRAVAISDDDVVDAAFGTAQTVTDGVTATTDAMISAESAAVTIAGTPAEGDWVVFEVYRDAANGSDTLAVDASLLGVLMLYGTTSMNDA